MRIQLSANHYRHSLRFALLGALLSVLILRMEGTTQFAGVLYFAALAAYLLVRWRVTPWKLLPTAEPLLEARKALALNSTHFVVFGMLLGALLVMITANELRRFAPEFTVSRVAHGYKSGAYQQPKMILPIAEKQHQHPGGLLVIGRVEEQAVLLELNDVISDVARDGLNELSKYTIALFLLPCIGIFVLKLLEAVALL